MSRRALSSLPVFPAKQTMVSEDFRPPASFPDARTRHQYIAVNLKHTSHILSLIHGAVAGAEVESERSVLVDAREIIRTFKRSGDESLLEELRQMILYSVIFLCVMQKDEISGCHFLTRPLGGHFV